MNRLLAKLFPRHFRRLVQVHISVNDWREFETLIKNSKKKMQPGDNINLVDENTGTVVMFCLTRGKEAAKNPST